MKKLALLLALCLAATMLPVNALAEDVQIYAIDAEAAQAMGDTGAPGLVAVPEEAEGEDALPVAEAAAEEAVSVEAAGVVFENEAQPEETRYEPALDAAVLPPHVDPDGPLLAANELTLGAGETFALKGALPPGKDGGIAYAVDDPATAWVDETGVVTALAPGEARVIAAAQDGTWSECLVHVRLAPEKVAFSAKAFEIGKGEQAAAPAVILGDGDGSCAGAVTYISSNKKVVTVDGGGVLKGVKTGSATITARTYNGKAATCKVTVRKAPGKVTLSVDKKELGLGEWAQAAAALPKSTASRLTFASETPETLAVDPATGAIFALGVGEGRVRVSTFNGKKATVKISVKPAPEAVSLGEGPLTLGVGMSVKLSAGLNDGAAGAVEYIIADPAVATYAGGAVKGVAPGETFLVARTYNGLEAALPVSVRPAPAKVSLPASTLSLGVGESFQLAPFVDGDAVSFYTFSTSSKKVATVSAAGLVKGVKKGSATITVKTYNGKSCKLKVSVLKAPGSVSLSPGTAELAVGETLQLKATLPKSTAGGVAYASGDPAVAAVDPLTGLVTAVGPGQTLIDAVTFNGKRAACAVTVYAAPEWVRADADFIELAEGDSCAIAAELSPGSRSPLFYESLDPAVAAVSPTGLVTAVGGGTTLVRVSTNVPWVFCEVSVTVRPAPAWVSLGIAELTLGAGETAQLTPVVPEGSVARFTFASSDPRVAAVSPEGAVTALRKGTATLTVATHNGLTAALALTVLDPLFPDAVALTNAPEYMSAGETLQLEYAVEPAGALADLDWSSSNPSVATVDAGGRITAHTFGYTVISAASRRNEDIALRFTLAVQTDNVVLAIPARTTDIAGIPANLRMIEALRACAIRQIDALQAGKVVSAADANKRRSIVNNAFADYAFPWMTPEYQVYWRAANSEGGAKDFKPDRVYYGMPYNSNANGNRQYNAAKALAEKRYVDSGAGYYLLNRQNLFKNYYVGNDCSCFVDAAIWGTNSSHSADRTTEIAKSSAYRTIADFKAMRTGDLICKSGAHVVMFLYYANAEKTKIMIIENGGSEPGTNTVHCIVMDLAYYTSRGYSVRRLASLG